MLVDEFDDFLAVEGNLLSEGGLLGKKEDDGTADLGFQRTGSLPINRT